MTLSYLRNILFLFDLFAVLVHCADLNVTGETITTRFWDCCKPSCSWNGKAHFSQPVESCYADDKPAPISSGTGCGEGGSAYTCSDQQPWSVNDTLSYGFAGIFITGHSDTEEFWCCACYQLNFTSDPIKGKTMIVQASNSAFDVSSVNRFSLAVCSTTHKGQDLPAKYICRYLEGTPLHMMVAQSSTASTKQCLERPMRALGL